MNNVTHISEESGEQTTESAVIDLGGIERELHLPKLDKPDHPKIPETNQEYLAREINGVTDVELLSYVMEDPDFYAMLEGEAGTGKNFSIDHVCEAANWPRIRVNFSISSTYENLVGRYAPSGESNEDGAVDRLKAIENTAQRLLEQDNKISNRREAIDRTEACLPNSSNFRWVDGLLTQAVKNGWAFVADEINAGDDSALMPLNGLTEDRNSRYLTIEEKSETIEPHENFRFLATRNPIEYTGAGDMNSALESRGYIIKYDYHETEALKEILRSRSNVVENESEDTLDSFISFVNDIRKQEQQGQQIMTKVASRDCIKVCRLTDIMSMREAAKTVIGGVADPTDKDAIMEMLNTQRFE